MQLGMIGLGRMGGNMVRRVMHAGHDCVAYDHSADAVRALTDEGARKALHRFLGDDNSGMFRGPFLRLRTPFVPAAVFVRPSRPCQDEGSR